MSSRRCAALQHKHKNIQKPHVNIKINRSQPDWTIGINPSLILSDPVLLQFVSVSAKSRNSSLLPMKEVFQCQLLNHSMHGGHL